MLYENKKPLPDGWSVGTQVPLDDRLVFNTTADLQNLGVAAVRAYRYYKGMKALVLADKSEYIWLPSPTGLLPLSFTYPANHIVAGVTYSNIAYNFVSVEATASDFLEVSGPSKIYNLPIFYPALAVVDGNAAPPTVADQDIYIITDLGNGVVHPDWNGAYDSWCISEEGLYASILPTEGVTCYAKDTGNTMVYKTTWINLLDGGEF
jgi:hypothetical protein